jgi:hypothetical protein
MNEETITKLTRAIELLTKKEEMEAQRAEESMKREKMWKEIDITVRPLRDAKNEEMNVLIKANRLKEDTLHDKKETAIVKIENAIRKKYGEPEQKPYLRITNAINSYPCSPLYR